MDSIQLMGLVITLSLTLHNTLAWRNYNLLLTDVKCIVNPAFVSLTYCMIDNTTSVPSLNVDGYLIRQIKSSRLDFSVDMERDTGNDITLFRGNNIHICELLVGTVKQPLVKMFKEMTTKFGAWPTKCPVPAIYHYNFTNLTLDSDYLPTFVPQNNFKISINIKDMKVSFWRLKIFGSVVNKKQNKKHRNF